MIKKIKLKNNFILAPMCQYMAKNGEPTEWHYQHLGKAILSGFSNVHIIAIKIVTIHKKIKIKFFLLSISNILIIVLNIFL